MTKYVITFGTKTITAKSENAMRNALREIRDHLYILGDLCPHAIVTTENGKLVKDIEFRCPRRLLGKVRMVNTAVPAV